MLEFKLPSLGADMDEGTLVQWQIKPGDVVKRGDVVAVVDTSKAAIDVESWIAGTVQELLVQAGDKIPVGTVMALLAEPGEAVATTAAADAEAVKEIPAEAAKKGASKGASKKSSVNGPKPAKTTGETPTLRRKISPAARRRAEELGVKLEQLEGSGPQGAITLADVNAALAAASEKRDARPVKAAAVPDPARDRRADMRRTIAAAMARSKREIPHYYLGQSIPLDAAMTWLETCNAQRPLTERVLLAALLLKVVALAARKYPELNGFYREDRFEPGPGVHLGVAISLRGGGLIAPALHDCDSRPLGELMQGLSDLVRRARSGSLRSSEVADPTLTVTNLGEQSVAEVYGVIYPPQVALVGFGGISEQVIADKGAIRVAPVLHISLSADHRVSDGHRGALFLAHIAALLQDPARLGREAA
ncbi:MAG: dihydrolipoamide acetyltransferase family protein [Pseudomonadales bacterium]|nr:dihydrolipoamide acetyltransferase family protein [Pseudomonadales bacterium]